MWMSRDNMSQKVKTAYPVLTMRWPWNNSESQQHQKMSGHRLSINWRSGWKKTQFLTSLMTSPVRKSSFTDVDTDNRGHESWYSDHVAVIPWCTCTSAVNSLHNCTCSARPFFFFKFFFLLILNRKNSCWWPTFLMKRVLCICYGCGILETTCLASTNVN